MAKQLNLYDKQQDMFNIGEYLPLPNLTLINGDEVTFRQVMGKYTLVDFWGTWCSNCENNNLLLKDIYEANFPKGFRIVQFAVDDNAEKVNTTVIADSIKWAIVADYKQWESPFLDELKINSIPSNYLIDRHGLIIDKNLTPNKLNELLNKLLVIKPAPIKILKPAVDSVKVDTIR
jgi:thiol-disulfide isomerase/thioredoxin